ncbi:hypothetical protein KDL01_17265 [Actinospica durhamensis]|uniref:Uncharacterized protein n=1 Tax=Actinospica durhamensis TaxID=1508375 RepID=A0A941EQ13_9ACTN|nr:hypothetical protein [Actinospica durhamensis]MBR7835028.1 hypothetical protein [Actinospica durhamensis]
MIWHPGPLLGPTHEYQQLTDTFGPSSPGGANETAKALESLRGFPKPRHGTLAAGFKPSAALTHPGRLLHRRHAATVGPFRPTRPDTGRIFREP